MKGDAGTPVDLTSIYPRSRLHLDRLRACPTNVRMVCEPLIRDFGFSGLRLMAWSRQSRGIHGLPIHSNSRLVAFSAWCLPVWIAVPFLNNLQTCAFRRIVFGAITVTEVCFARRSSSGANACGSCASVTRLAVPEPTPGSRNNSAKNVHARPSVVRLSSPEIISRLCWLHKEVSSR